MRQITIHPEEIERFQPHLDRMMEHLFDCVPDDEIDSLHEFCQFIDRVLGPYPEKTQAS